MKNFKVAIILISLALMAAFSVSWISIYNFKMQKNSVIIEFLKGESFSSVSKKLEKDNIIYDSFLFKLNAWLLGLDKQLKPGEYYLSSEMSHTEILDKITSGKVYYRKITIPEGLTVKEIKKIIEKSEFLSGELTKNLQEGYLLPETYYFQKGDSVDSLVLQMEDSFYKSLDNIWDKRNFEKLKGIIKTKNDLVILASIIEKEALLDSEKPTIAAVYLNRLRVGMRLQADPTVIYGAKNYQGDITYKMLKERNDYNTYTMYGLPKTPISNPGLSSLMAAANPADVNYLYFVADGKGGHKFSTNYEEHRKNVRVYLKKQKETK